MMGENLLHFHIHYSGDYEDWFEVSGETIEEVKAEAYEGCFERGWDISRCWSEEVPSMRWRNL